jgi:phospholipase/carboxylesterase
VLLLGGALDDRREASDTPQLAEQFRLAGAVVTAHVLDVGHGLEDGGDDENLARDWLGSIEQDD